MLYSRLVGNDLTGLLGGEPEVERPRGKWRGVQKAHSQGPTRLRDRAGNSSRRCEKQMSHTWKFLPIAALFALGLLVIGVPNGTRIAQADINDVTVDGSSISSGDNITVKDGDTIDIEVSLNGDRPSALEIRTTGIGSGSDIQTNFDSCDDNSGPSADDCDVDSGDGTEDIVVSDPTYDSGPEGLQRVAVSMDVSCSDPDTMRVHIDETDGSGDSFTFDIECGYGTPTATATKTVGPAQTVVVASSNSTLGCGATSIVTVTVKDGTGKAVANGTLVNIVADLGSVSPTSGQTTADGSVFVFYTAPNNTGGKATISAASGSALGTAEVTINCNTAPTQAPPPTTAAGGGIQPPNTGDGGLATSNSWHTYAGIALILSSVIATLVVVRPRA
jgi:hypothetical protein